MRGFWHLVDAVMASIIMMGFVGLMSQTIIFTPETEGLNFAAFQELKELDEQGVLRDYAVAMDPIGLDSKVTLYAYSHTIQICDYSGTCVGERPEDENVWVGTYMVSGKDYYSPHTIKLYIW